MTNLINTTGVNIVNHLSTWTSGHFRFVIKNRAGFLTVQDAMKVQDIDFIKRPETLLTLHQKGALQTVEFCPEGAVHYSTVFARKGKKVILLDQAIMANLKLGTVSTLFGDTNLNSGPQRVAVNATQYSDLLFRVNQDAATDAL